MAKMLDEVGGTAAVIAQSLNKNSYKKGFLEKKAEKLKSLLYQNLKPYLSGYPTLGGSTIEGTAILGSDIDIQVRFKKDSTLIEDMKELIESLIEEKFKDQNLVQIRDQEFSIGLLFEIKGQDQRIDIVPMREIENGHGDAFIYSSSTKSIKKTNASKQYRTLKFTEKQKKIIHALKGWKMENGIEISSTYIEFLVLRAFRSIHIPRGVEKSLLRIVEFIADNITTIRIVDPGNSNNVISSNLSINEKEVISQFCYKMLSEIKKDERNILDYFPL